jgi:hypothetical protein
VVAIGTSDVEDPRGYDDAVRLVDVLNGDDVGDGIEIRSRDAISGKRVDVNRSEGNGR